MPDSNPSKNGFKDGTQAVVTAMLRRHWLAIPLAMLLKIISLEEKYGRRRTRRIMVVIITLLCVKCRSYKNGLKTLHNAEEKCYDDC